MILILWIFCLIDITLNNNVATIQGDGTVLQSDVRSKTYESIIEAIIEYGPTGLGDAAFDRCSALQSVTFSYSVATILGQPFSRCSALSSFIVPQGHQFLSTPSEGGLCNPEQIILYRAPAVQYFTIPESIEELHQGCFQGISILEEIDIPPSVIGIYVNCFNEMKPLSKVTFSHGSNLKVIYSNSFWYGSALEIHIPPSVEVIMNNAFTSSNSISIIFDDIENSNLTTIHESAFSSFISTTFTLPPRVQAIPDYCFQSSINLESINIPEDCTFISETAFADCPNLKSITVDPGNQKYSSFNGAILDINGENLIFLPTSLTTWNMPSTLEKVSLGILQNCKELETIDTSENDNFDCLEGVLYNNLRTVLICKLGSVTSVSVDSNTQVIENSAFANSEMTSITFQSINNLHSIYENAFKYCTGIDKLILPKSISVIASQSFSNSGFSTIEIDEDSPLSTINAQTFQYSRLTTFTISKNINQINEAAFFGCAELTTIIIVSDGEQIVLTNKIFCQCIKLLSISSYSRILSLGSNVFEGDVLLSFDFTQATSLVSIGELSFSHCNLQSISMTPSLTEAKNKAFQSNLGIAIADFSLCTLLTTIGPSLFNECSNLAKVILPPNMDVLEPSAFTGCVMLDCFEISDEAKFWANGGIVYQKESWTLIVCGQGVSSADICKETKLIGSESFYNCAKLVSVTFITPSNITALYEGTFVGCSSLTTVSLPDSIQSLSSRCFKDFKKLQIVDFVEPSSIESIGESSFSGCAELSHINFPSSLRQIGLECFLECTNLKSVTFHSEGNLNEIPLRCFKRSGLENVELSDNIESICEEAFAHCYIRSIRLSSSISYIGSDAFGGCDQLFVIEFCGTEEIAQYGTKVFPSNAIIIVTETYQSQILCGYNVVIGMNSQCMYFPTNTRGFTKLPTKRIFIIMIVVSLIISNDNKLK